jgi:hypothetical protein
MSVRVRFQARLIPPMDIVRYISISLTGLLAGAAVGCIGGLSLGWLLALGHHNHGPGPDDAPAYVAVGLSLIGAFLGAIIGFAIGIIFCVRLARRKALNQSA